MSAIQAFATLGDVGAFFMHLALSQIGVELPIWIYRIATIAFTMLFAYMFFIRFGIMFKLGLVIVGIFLVSTVFGLGAGSFIFPSTS